MGGLSGKELFKLNLEQLESLCGEKDGKRLYNLLLLQKNKSGVSKNAHIHSNLLKFLYVKS